MKRKREFLDKKLDFSKKRRYTLGEVYLTDQGVEQEK